MDRWHSQENLGEIGIALKRKNETKQKRRKISKTRESDNILIETDSIICPWSSPQHKKVFISFLRRFAKHERTLQKEAINYQTRIRFFCVFCVYLAPIFSSFSFHSDSFFYFSRCVFQPPPDWRRDKEVSLRTSPAIFLTTASDYAIWIIKQCFVRGSLMT